MSDTSVVPVQCRFGPVRDVTAEVDSLFEATATLNRGDSIGYGRIEEVIGVSQFKDDKLVRDPLFIKIVKVWRSRMRDERGIWPVAVKGVGFYFPNADEQISKVADSFERSADRKIRKGQRIAQAVDAGELTDTQKRYRDERVGQASAVLATTQRNRLIRSKLASPDTLPRPNGQKT